MSGFTSKKKTEATRVEAPTEAPTEAAVVPSCFCCYGTNYALPIDYPSFSGALGGCDWDPGKGARCVRGEYDDVLQYDTYRTYFECGTSMRGTSV